MSRLAMEDSAGIVSRWIRNSVSWATWAAYERMWLEWRALVREAGVDLMSQEVRLLVLYFLARNMKAGVSRSALSKKLAGLAFLFKWQGCPDFTTDFWVRQAFKGYSCFGQHRDVRRPVSFDILEGDVDAFVFIREWGHLVQGGFFVDVIWGL